MGSPNQEPDPRLAWKVQASRRASVSASRSGDGWAGSKSENWAARAGVGQARSETRASASRGGWATRSSSTSVRQVRAPPEGAAGRSERLVQAAMAQAADAVKDRDFTDADAWA